MEGPIAPMEGTIAPMEGTIAPMEEPLGTHLVAGRNFGKSNAPWNLCKRGCCGPGCCPFS